MKNVTPERVVKEEEEDDDSDGGSFPTIDPYELVKDKRHKSVSVALTDELTGKAEYTTVPVYRLCPYCEFLCPRATDGCKHTKCSNPSCGNWFCHVCLRVPPEPIDLSQCYVRRDNSIVRWGCGEGQLKAYTICPVRNRRMVYPTQTRENKNDWKVRKIEFEEKMSLEGGGDVDFFPYADEVISSNPSILDNPRRRTNPSAFQNNRSNFVPDHPPRQQQNPVEEFPSDADFPDVQDLSDHERVFQGLGAGNISQIGGMSNPSSYRQPNIGSSKNQFSRNPPAPSNGGQEDFPSEQEFVGVETDEYKRRKLRTSKSSIQSYLNLYRRDLEKAKAKVANGVSSARIWVKHYDKFVKEKEDELRNVKMRLGEDVDEVRESEPKKLKQKPKPKPKPKPKDPLVEKKKSKYNLYCLNCSRKREFIFAKKGLNPGIFFYKCLTCNKTKSDRKDPKIRVEAKKKTKYKPVLTYCGKCHGDTVGQFLNQGHNPKFFCYKCMKCGEENISKIKPEKE